MAEGSVFGPRIWQHSEPMSFSVTFFPAKIRKFELLRSFRIARVVLSIPLNVMEDECWYWGAAVIEILVMCKDLYDGVKTHRWQ